MYPTIIKSGIRLWSVSPVADTEVEVEGEETGAAVTVGLSLSLKVPARATALLRTSVAMCELISTVASGGLSPTEAPVTFGTPFNAVVILPIQL